MKIFNISHVRFPNEHDPVQWINKSRFFKGAWEAVAEKEEVFFVEFINHIGRFNYRGIEYWFQKKSLQGIRFPLRMYRLIEKANPDVVIVHGMHFPLQVILLRYILNRKCKIIVQDHGGGMFRNPLKKLLQKKADRCINAYFFTAIGQTKVWQDTGIIKNISKVHEVMEISSVFQPELSETALAFTKIEKTNAYIWVGHLNINKDPLLVVKAFTQFVAEGRDAHLYMIFQSNGLLPQIQSWLSNHPNAANHIHLVGKVVHADLQHWLCSVDFIISSSHYEAGGVSVCEGMSCGCIPILSNIPSFLFMTGNTCGFIYETGNEQSLLDALYASARVNISIEKQKTLARFEQRLSFKAIANHITQVLYNL